MAIIFNPRPGISHICVYFTLIYCMKAALGNLVFQPVFVVASGPRVTAFLQGNTSGISVIVRSVSPLNTTGRLPPPSCAEEDPGQWILTQETVDKSVVKVTLSLNRSLQLCGNETDCCPEPLCVQEILQVSACLGDEHRAALLVQAQIYALILPTGPLSENKTAIPNQAYQPLGPCPCDLNAGACDVRCCCDQDCSPDVLKLFGTQCLPGVFGGNVTPAPDYQCSAQSASNAPDWFPFLCVTSPPENNPYLGLFHQGQTVTPKRSASFQAPVLTAPLPPSDYRQGDPLFTARGQYFTIPQRSLAGQCLSRAPVAFLWNFETYCVTRLQSCPTGPPLFVAASELGVPLRDGLGGIVTVSVTEMRAGDLGSFVSVPVPVKSGSGQGFPPEPLSAGPPQLCENVTVALNYTFYWSGNGLTNVTLTQTLADVSLDPSVSLTVRFSARFVNGDGTAQSNSGNPGYQTGLPVFGGSVDAAANDSAPVRRVPLGLWETVGEGLCASASSRPVLFGENATAGCLVPVGLLDLAQCAQLRETVRSTLAALVNVTYVARNGNPDSANLADWVNITFVPVNASNLPVAPPGTCTGVPAHLNIHIGSTAAGQPGAQLQREIRAVEVSFAVTTWAIECGGGDPAPCLNSAVTQSFPISSSVTFIDIPAQTAPPKTRFQINFTEYDCDRNDVCWPQLAYPLTRYYTGEPYSQSLAKGLILVFFFIAASVLGSPWKQIRQAWSNASL
ncbi:tectonic-2 [Anguilla anguilla]|uniref:tectonic-2 n=1 Tax=Anguilla anguilla TaxID=7936 RepID=UPI0015A796EE|nr:tectonic-2 [Anguilla anguilla]